MPIVCRRLVEVLKILCVCAAAAAAPHAARADPCDEVTPVAAGQTAGSITGAATVVLPTNCGTGRIGRWFRYQPIGPGFVTVSVCNATFPVQLTVTAGCSTQFGPCATTSQECTSINTLASMDPVYICINAPAGSTGAFQLIITPLPNTQADDCTGANPLPAPAAGNITFWADTRGATRDGGSSCDAATAYPDRWFRFTPAQDVLFSITNPLPAGVLSLHSGCPGTPANELACAASSGQPLNVSLRAGAPCLIRVGARNSFGAWGVLNASTLPGRTGGADALVPRVGGMTQFARDGGIIACAADAQMCNRGDQPLDCYANPDPRHPFIAMNIYRLEPVPGHAGATRIKQIAVSWAKHVRAGGYENGCSYGCGSTGISPLLLPGCSDTYSSGTNVEQSGLGPRWEINPWTGGFDFAGSILNQPLPPQTPLSRRMQLADADIDPAVHPSASYLAEVYAVFHQDQDHLNSIAHQSLSIRGASGGTWTFSTLGAGVVGPAVTSWVGSNLSTAPPTVDAASPDGRCLIASRITPNGDGTWHYEYAVYNHDLDRGLRSFRIPLRPGTGVLNPDFGTVESHDGAGEGGAPYDNNPWSPAITPGAVAWSTNAFTSATANPLRWGTLANFSFDSPAAPGQARASLALFKPSPSGGLSDSVEAVIPGPALCPADFDLRGTVSIQDLFDYLIAYFQGDIPADFDRSGVLSLQDLFDYIRAFLSPC